MPIILLASILLPSLVSAQSFTFAVYQAGASAPQQSYPLSPLCDQADPGPSNPVNPTKVAWDDVSKPGRFCVAQAADIFSRPVGTYEGTVTITTSGGSAESARVAFSKVPVAGCKDGAELYPVGMLLTARSQPSQSAQRAMTTDYNSRGWSLYHVSKVLKGSVDLTFRCQG